MERSTVWDNKKSYAVWHKHSLFYSYRKKTILVLWYFITIQCKDAAFKVKKKSISTENNLIDRAVKCVATFDSKGLLASVQKFN